MKKEVSINTLPNEQTITLTMGCNESQVEITNRNNT